LPRILGAIVVKTGFGRQGGISGLRLNGKPGSLT
jgi:hypothetical protein